MKKIFFATVSTALLIANASAQTSVEMTVTVIGQIQKVTFELDEKLAPKTCANFKKLVSEQYYDGLAFHRVIPNYIAQTGDPLTRDQSKKIEWGMGGPGYTVPAEFGGKHVRGALATARLPDQRNPNKASNGSQFFVCLTAIEALDGDYTVFGKVTSGMDVMDRIASVKTDEAKNPVNRVEIRSMRIVQKTAPPKELTTTSPKTTEAPLTPPTPLAASAPAPSPKPMPISDKPAPIPSTPTTPAPNTTDPAFKRPKSMLGSNPTPAPTPQPLNGTSDTPLIPPMPDLNAVSASKSSEPGFQRPTSMLGDTPVERPTALGSFGEGAQTEIASTKEFQRPVPITQQNLQTPLSTGTTTIVPARANPLPQSPQTPGAAVVSPTALPAPTEGGATMPAAAELPAQTPPAKQSSSSKKKGGPVSKFLRRFW